MTQEEQATAMQRWLSGPPGSAPPTDLDDDVVEAVYALRPDLAPAPVLDLDDLLGSLGAGPLASEPKPAPTLEGGGEVVPFPVAARPRPAPAESASSGRSAWRWATLAAGGTSGVGLLVAAAAVLVFVALPQLSTNSPEAGPTVSAPSAATQASPAEPLAAARAPAPPPTEEVRLERQANEGASRLAARAAGPMAGSADRREQNTIPELSTITAAAPPAADPSPADDALADEVVADDAVADLDLDERVADAPPVPPDVAEEEKEELEQPMPELAKQEQFYGGVPAGVAAAPAMADAKVARQKEKRARDEAPAQAEVATGSDAVSETVAVSSRAGAVPRDLGGNGWRRGVDPATQQVFDAALTEAEVSLRQGDPARGAERLSMAVGAPARAGQYVAGKAASAWLSAGDPAKAAEVARRGLALSSANTAERSFLLLVLGDALRAQADTAGAEDAWTQAAAANASR